MIRSPPAPAIVDALLDGLESAGLGCTIVAVRGDGKLERVYANEALARIYGVDVETLRRATPLELPVFASDEVERLLSRSEEVARDAPWPPFIESYIRRIDDGRRVPVEVALGRCALEGGHARFAFVRDISAKTALAAALRESEQRFRSVAEASPDSITILSNGQYIYANPVALERIGVRSLEELRAVDPMTGIPPDQLERFQEYRRKLEAGEPVSPVEHTLRTPDGEERILETSLSLTTIEGQPATISYTRDITDRINLQAKLLKRDRLASVGVLAAGVAHEINNPLASVALQVRRLRESADQHALSPELRAAIEQIDEGTRRMSAIISDLLFLARPVDAPQAHVDVGQILASTIALVRAGTPEPPRVRVDLGELPPIHGFPSKLGQVFLNVLRNAVQAVEGVEGGEITVVAAATPETIDVTISDNGRGIPERVMPEVTRPFFTTKPDGTGIGLWISQTLVGQHGGTLEVASVEGDGTTVRIRLPTSRPLSR